MTQLRNCRRARGSQEARLGAIGKLNRPQVDDALRGTGAGGKLVAAAGAWARAENVKLPPLCPFARSVFDKTPGYADVLTG